MKIYADTIYTNNGIKVVGSEYSEFTLEEWKEVAEKIEDSEIMKEVAQAICFEKVLGTDEDDWYFFEGDKEDFGRELVRNEYNLSYDLEDYFDFERFAEDYIYDNDVVETNGGFLCEV